MTTEELIAARRAEPWREALRKSKKNKERTDIPRVEMNELDAEYRSHTRLEEVNLGLTKEQAMQEAQRCLDCPNPTCMQGCPVSINIPTFVKNIERGEFLEAARVLKETSALPAVCGRVCPQEKQCESKCIHLKMGKPAVAIGYLERFAADYERESGNISIPEVAEKNGIKIAVVGSGPAGLSFAGDMAKRGYDVTVFEALHEIGGVLKYGIPEFRLPNKIVDVEIEGLRKMGVKTVMVTGDNPLTAKYIAEQAGVDDFIAEAKPEDKMEYIKREQRAGKLVAMMGDGTNDAPALAQADVGVAMNSGTQAAKEAGNMVDLDNDPTKLIEIVEIGKQLLMTRGTLTTFSIANDVAKYFAIVPALFITSIPALQTLNIMHLHSPESAILSAVIFNAIIIPLLIPLALRGVAYKPIGASALLRRNLFIYGLGGIIVPFIGIKLIDMLVSVFF